MICFNFMLIHDDKVDADINNNGASDTSMNPCKAQSIFNFENFILKKLYFFAILKYIIIVSLKYILVFIVILALMELSQQNFIFTSWLSVQYVYFYSQKLLKFTTF